MRKRTWGIGVLAGVAVAAIAGAVPAASAAPARSGVSTLKPPR